MIYLHVRAKISILSITVYEKGEGPKALLLAGRTPWSPVKDKMIISDYVFEINPETELYD